MPLTSQRTRRLALAGLASVAAVAASAPSASAASATLTYQCKYPLIGTQPLSIAIDLDIPESFPAGQETPAFAIKAVATAGGNTSKGLSLVDGLASIEGVSTAKSTVNLANGEKLSVSVPITIPNYVVPTPAPDPLVLNAEGETPPLTFDDPGDVSIVLDSLALNLKALDSTGTPIELPPLSKDVDGNAVKDSDGDPGTFDVYCKLDAGQDTTLANVTITGGGTEPTTPEPTTPEPTTPEPTTPEPTTPEPTTPEPTTPEPTTPEPTTPEPTTPEPTTPEPTTPEPTTPEPTTPEPTTPGGGVNYSYDLKGSTKLNTGTKGTLPLKGGIDANLTLATGDFTADLTLDPTKGKLTALGFLPVSVKIAFSPEGKTTGKLDESTLTSTSKVGINVSDVKLFGGVRIAGGPNCKAKEPSQIDLKSGEGEFSALEGGKLTGKYKIAALTGCGGLNGLVSSLTAGGNNTIDVDLTAKSGQQG